MGKTGRKSKRAQRGLKKTAVGAPLEADGWRDGGAAAEAAAGGAERERAALAARAAAAAAAHRREQGGGDGGGEGSDGGDQVDAGALLDSSAALASGGGAALVSAPRKKGSNASKSRPASARPLSKSERRKLEKLEKERRLRAQRAAAFETMAAAALPRAHAALLAPSATMGKRATRREEARRGLAMERAGVVEEDAPHLKRRKIDDAGADANADADDPELAAAAAAAAAEAAAFAAAAAVPAAAAPMPLTADVDPDADDWDADADGGGEFDVPAFLAARAAEDAAGDTVGRAGAELLDRDTIPAKAYHRPVKRPADVEESRQGLPIIDMEQEIMEAIAGNLVTVLCGATGSGKTTQLPQFLFEAGYGDAQCAAHPGGIAVTQPRRVAASAGARRVATEMGLKLGEEVGYQVRHDRRCGDKPAIKFMTDGLLLKEVESDLLLEKYSVVIIDEAHERTLGTDVLLGLLSRAVPLRARMAAQGTPHPTSGAKLTPLRLVIMSATLRVEDFAGNRALFPRAPPVLKVPARQFPVGIHFARRTEMDDYVREATRAVSKIHRRLPEGGILVFLTGRSEVERAASATRREFKRKSARDRLAALEEAETGADADEETVVPGAAGTAGAVALRDDDAFAADDDAEAAWGDEGSDDDYDAGADDDFDDEFLGEDLIAEANEARERARAEGGQDDEGAGEGGVHVLPLYAQLPPSAQMRVFRPPPDGKRLIVYATNVAETSLTIPGIRYVVDCGRHKERVYSRGGVSSFEVGWISRASAEQRAGRAGRTGPGHCYRLYSSAVCQELKEHFPPAIETTPVDGVALQLRAMGIDRVENFPFATPPPPQAMAEAHATLLAVGALRRPDGALPASATYSSSGAREAVLTVEGRRMAGLPVSPRVARCLLVALREGGAGVAAHALRLAAALSHENPFLQQIGAAPEADEKAAKAARKAAKQRQAQYQREGGEAVSAAAALAAYEAEVGTAARGAKEAWCAERALRPTVLAEAAALVEQLARSLLRGAAGSGLDAATLAAVEGATDAAGAARAASRPSVAALRALRRAACAGWADRIARRARATEGIGDGEGMVSEEVARAGKAIRYMTTAAGAPVAFMHPNSVLARAGPEFVVFTGVVKGAKRPYLECATPIEADWLAELAPGMVTLGSPLSDPPPHYDARRDEVCCFREASLTARGWLLPKAVRPMPDETKARAVFACALLQGSAARALQSADWDRLAAGGLLTPPATLVRPHAMTASRCAALLDALRARHVRSVRGLDAALRADRSYLRREMAMWLPDGAPRQRLRASWPQIVKDIARTAKALQRA